MASELGSQHGLCIKLGEGGFGGPTAGPNVSCMPMSQREEGAAAMCNEWRYLQRRVRACALRLQLSLQVQIGESLLGPMDSHELCCVT